ncbi:hypothetical protein EB796_001753 [Bugula neritina]|uniref:Uncharacterized protein n=1 Tax=Bugula neritina TaxID=10212 RepID=A0A7J7KP00_BUGNE|nr:hypothetical protein EB796_001753 [Bugula neritina]
MPTYRPPTLPPSLPARPSTSNKLHIKRVATPTSDLLDLGDDLSLPSFSSVELFDPLFTSSEEAKKELEDTFSNISSDDVLDEDVTEEITQPTAVALSLSQPSTPESQDPPQRPFKPRSLSTTSHKQLRRLTYLYVIVMYERNG